MRTVRVSGGLALALCLVGCLPTKLHFVAEGSPTGAPRPSAEDHDLVGVAISGGGSRAAVYGAAGLEALWEHGILERADYLSSVSGGAIAASWFVKAHALDHAPLDAPFFARFRTEMRRGLWGAIERRQVYKCRWFSASRLSSSLEEVLDRRFLGGVTLGTLEQALPPRLLISATVYDSGRRFVFTTLGQDEVQLDFGALPGTARELAARAAVQPVTFADPSVLGALPRDFPLALAVAASAAAPVVMGPVTIRVGATYWHLGDGGLYDNSGVETLEQVVLRKLQTSASPGKGLIVALDARFNEDPQELAGRRKFRVTSHPTLLVDIPTARAEAYHDVVWQELASRGVRQLVLRHTAARLDPARLPQSCSEEKDLCAEPTCREALERRLARIPTHLKISACDADLIELAAHAVVHEALSAEFPATRPCRLAH